MATALYDPDLGYYTGTDRIRVGRRGDFFTSVSVGPLFGRLLALRLAAFWESLGRPEECHLLEPGPEGGQLALDILAATRTDHPEFHGAIRYHACEPVPAKRELLARQLAEAGESGARAVSTPDEVRGTHGAVIANEILDALPVRLVSFRDGRWHERRVTAIAQSLGWTTSPIDEPRLAAATEALGQDFPDGYTTEICLAHETFLAPLASAFDHALLTFIDYGFSRADLHHPSRTEGTLRTYDRHQAGNDPLDRPGTRDITAHVNFSDVLDTGRHLGLRPVGFTRQERYLTAIAEPLLRDLDPESPDTPGLARQFQTLTHPAMLGSRFHVLELTRNAPPPAAPSPFRFDAGGLAHLDESPLSPPNSSS